MTKKNLMMRIASVLLIAVVLTTSVIGGTLAKYTSSVTTTVKATAASWDFKLNDKALSETFEFDLGEYIDTDPNVDTTAKIVAPGTKGSFELKLTNLSQVSANYTIDITIPSTGLPENFSIVADSATGLIKYANTSDTEDEKVITINWEWPFNDSLDEDEQFAGNALPTIQVKVTLNQAD